MSNSLRDDVKDLLMDFMEYEILCDVVDDLFDLLGISEAYQDKPARELVDKLS